MMYLLIYNAIDLMVQRLNARVSRVSEANVVSFVCESSGLCREVGPYDR